MIQGPCGFGGVPLMREVPSIAWRSKFLAKNGGVPAAAALKACSRWWPLCSRGAPRDASTNDLLVPIFRCRIGSRCPRASP